MKKKLLAVFMSIAMIATMVMPAMAEEIPGDEAVAVTEESEIETEAFNALYYNITTSGGTFDGNYYTLPDGTIVHDAFFCDGTYTYFLQTDGTPMKDRLTYHPDGVHVIYFDSNGHEVFSDFANVKKSIAGDPVNDLCFFDVYGYLYVNNLTYDKAGTRIYYANACGVMECNGWFQFAANPGGIASALGIDGNCKAYANADGTINMNTLTKISISSESGASSTSSGGSGTLVWLSATGSKYHSINNCGKMNPNRATQVTLSTALSRGYTKCSKCW